MKLVEGRETVTEIQSEFTRCHLQEGKRKCSINKCNNCPISNRNRCRSEIIVMGFTFIIIVIVFIFHYSVFSTSLTKEDSMSFTPPKEYRPEVKDSSLINQKHPKKILELTSGSLKQVRHEDKIDNSSSNSNSKFHPVQEHVEEKKGEINGTVEESVSWIERKIKGYDPKLYTEALITIDKVIQWVNSSLTLSIITPLVLGSSTGLILVLVIVYYRSILFCAFYCLTCGCITCYCRNRRRRQNYELGLKGNFLDGKRYDELENHYLLIPKQEEEAHDVDEDSDAEIELYTKQKVNV